jgi:3-hydroxybutyryl-CoA dehydrogenase
VRTITVLGAGIMGVGIAQVAAAGGYNVILRDLQKRLVDNGISTIEKNLQAMVDCAQFSREQMEEALARIEGTTDLEYSGQADLVIEAVVENMAVKKQIFTQMDSLCPPHTILASNTSTLSITEIAANTHRPDKILGMHFFYPVPKRPLVELVKGLETADETIDITREFCARIGKISVVLNRESPGYLYNRMVLSLINEAIHIYCDNLASREDIDRAICAGLGLPMGPLTLADIIGLDNLHNAMLLYCEEFHDNKYRPHPLFTTMIRAGHLGKKSGQGFYEYK